MQIHQSQNRQIAGFKLTIVLSPTKLIIRALSKDTSDLYICQFVHGQLRQDIKFQFQDEDTFFQELISPSTQLRVQKQELIVPYTVFLKNRPVLRQFVIPLIKVEANQIEMLKNKVNRLQEQAKKFALFEAQFKLHQTILDNLEKRSKIFHYSQGLLTPLILDEVNNPEYQIRLNFLRRKDVKKQDNRQSVSKLSQSLVSSDPIDERIKFFSYKITVYDILSQQNGIFIGLCIKKPENQQHGFSQNKQQFKFIIPHSSCDLYDSSHLNNDSINRRTNLLNVKKNDTFVLTVDLENSHLTWYKNGVSLERSYFQKPTTNIYPFIWMTPNTEVVF